MRWIHPTEGLMPPDRFIPLFEKNGFIIRLDEYIWEQACITLRNWIDHRPHAHAHVREHVCVCISTIRACVKSCST